VSAILDGAWRVSVGFLIGMRDEIDHDRGGQDQHGVLALVDVDRIRVGETEPLLAHARHLAAAAREDVFMVEEVALGFEVVGARDIDAELRAEQRDRCFLTTATVAPPRTISYCGPILSSFCSIRASSWPPLSLNESLLPKLNTFPSTWYAT